MAGAPPRAALRRGVHPDPAFVVGKPFIGPITHRWVSVLAYPILAPTGEVKGIVALPIDLVRYLSTARARGPLDDVGRSQGEVGSSRPHP